mgnify:CR=1
MPAILFRRGSAEVWTSKNPILNPGEPGYEIDTRRFKIGDGVTTWSMLPYLGRDPGAVTNSAELDDHIADLTPHAVYDDGPSLTLLYENAKV